MRTKTTMIIAAVAILLVQCAVFAQAAPATAPASPAPTAPSAVAASPAVSSDLDSRELRREFTDVLRRYPPEVGKVFSLDPTLLSDANYLKNYPDVAAFVAANPVVAHNPRYFLADVASTNEVAPPNVAQRMWEQTMEGLMILSILTLIAFSLAWVIRTIIEHRRWNRLSKVQAEVHTKLLDRLTSNEDLLAYIQTSPGRRFLESAPIQLESTPRQMAAPVSRILWSVQAGLVLSAAGVGLEIVSRSIEKEVSQPMFALGVVALAVGVGFVVSAIVSYAISRRLNLFDAPPADLTA